MVWSNDKVLNEQGIPHRLTTTLANLKRYFSSAKHKAADSLPISTVGAIGDEITDDPITASMIDHFKDLFDVESLEGIYPKMNELYVYVQETKTGLRILSSLLGLDDHVSIVRILEESANFIRNYSNNSTNGVGSDENQLDPLSVTGGYESAFEASTTIQV